MAEDRIVSALVENLMLVYPSGPPADESVVRKWLREIVVQTQEEEIEEESLLKESNNDQRKKPPSSTCIQRYESAMEIAVVEWKHKAAARRQDFANKNPLQNDEGTTTTNNKKVQKTSFSLFSQLDGGGLGMFGPRITLEDLQAATTPKDKLEALQKVSHVDDLVLDWKEVLPMLRDGLNTARPVVEEYCNLHKKWFDQGRSSTEYLPLRCDLCQNILGGIQKLVGTKEWEVEGGEVRTFSEVHETIFALWNLWFEMWCDLLQEPLGHDEADGSLASMGRWVLFLIRDMENTSVDNDTEQSPSSTNHTVYPAHFLALVDPMALWFRSWTNRLIPSELVKILIASGIVPDLWQRASSPAGTTTEDNSDNDVILTEQCQSRSQLLTVALKQHSISMLRSILVCTRIKYFPVTLIWDEHQTQTIKSGEPIALNSLQTSYERILATRDDQGTTKPSSGVSEYQIEVLFRLFFQVGISAALTKKAVDQIPPLVQICVEAIEVLLLGTKMNNKGYYARLVKLCHEQTTAGKDKQGFNLLLTDLLERLEY